MESNVIDKITEELYEKVEMIRKRNKAQLED
jgi:hypothetical protein